MNIELILSIIFLSGVALGHLSMWDLIRRYKKEQGFDPDPFDGREPTRLEKFVEKHRQKTPDLLKP